MLLPMLKIEVIEKWELINEGYVSGLNIFIQCLAFL